MNTCPICKSDSFQESINCPKHKDVICMDCCRQCEHYDQDKPHIAHWCRYRPQEAAERKDKITAIEEQIKFLDDKQDRLFREGNQRKAEDVVWEIVALKMKKEGLEKGA
ncbi:hypothetical protein Ami103574_04315 [Aminipila butyrica]|uniref:Uncharacterized protein n=1 Tax=Aminipila butyrica TaxID=433296 RepID=A0A858BRM6_9FIRM|nr:hypothetical protein [Aminipila butyrica]QIB68591.1 hypothetical protein Ami103574_04315 [Aminipila butyrica]